MTNNSHPTLERIARRVAVPEPAYDRLLRRRDRKERNRRRSAAALAIVLTLLSITALMRAFGSSERPATEPTPPVNTGIFSGLGGWIAYSDTQGALNWMASTNPLGMKPPQPIWAIDPERPQIRKQLGTHLGEPLAWSNDGLKLLILRRSAPPSMMEDDSLYVLNADGSETPLIDARRGNAVSGGSFSPDGSKVVYAIDESVINAHNGIYVVDAVGGTPRRLHESGLTLIGPTFSPDGSQIAYIQGGGDGFNTLRVMNADGSGSHILLKDHGVMRTFPARGHLVWSPDGRHLAFDLGYGPFPIYVVGSDGSGLKRVIPNGVDPFWSPDGSRIAYEEHSLGSSNNPSGVGPLAIADADGTHVQVFDNAESGPWNPLDRAESGTQGTSATAGATRPDALSYAIVAVVAVGIVVLWLLRKRKTWAEIKEKIG